MPAAPSEQHVPRAEEVFISYSRKDKDFVGRLDEELKRRDREAWVDWEGIPPGDIWEKTIYGAIEATHTFIFVLTPDSIASEVCGKEIAHAAANNKRLVPIVYRDVAAERVPKSLGELNWIFFRDSDDFQEAANKLVSALDTDLKWVRAHTRLLTRAIEWDANGRNNSFVLRGEDLRSAERWLAEAGAQKERQPTSLQTEYVIASRKASARRQRITLGAVTFGLIVSIVLAVLAFLARHKAVEQEAKAKAEASHSEYLRALSLVEDGDADEALRSLARSLELDPSNSAIATRLINLLGQRQWPHLVATQNHPLPISILEKSADTSRIIVATRSAGEEVQKAPRFIYFYDAGTLHPAGSAEVGAHDITDLQVSGDRLLASAGGKAFLLNAKTGETVKTWEDSVGSTPQCLFSDDGTWAVVWFKKFPADMTLQIVRAADGDPHPSVPRISPPIPSDNNDPILSTVMMNDGEIRILNGDGTVTIQSLDRQRAARAFPVMQDADVLLQPPYSDRSLRLARFGAGGNVLLGVSGNGQLHVWRLSQSGAKKATGLTSDGLTLLGMVSGKPTAAFHGADQVIIVAQDQNSISDSAHSCVTRIVQGGANDSDFKVDTDWHSSFRLVCVLSPGIAVAQATKAFVLPFHGGSLSGPVRHESQITAIREIREGVLATGAADGAVKLWNLTPPAFVVAPEAGPVEKSGTALLAQSRSRDMEIWGSVGAFLKCGIVIKRGGKDTEVQMPGELYGIGNVEVSADGKRGIFSGYGKGRPGSDGSGAWVFSTEDGRLVSKSVGICEWAGFTPDAKQVLTILHGSLQFWNLRQDEKGLLSFEPTNRVLSQANMTGAVVADHAVPDARQLVTLFQAGMTSAGVTQNGNRLATRSRTGDVIVWDGTEGKPLNLLRGDPLWFADIDATMPEQGSGIDSMRLDEKGSMVHDVLGLCKPALSADGRRLATAYGKAFVLWDVDSGKPLSDPIYCASEIQYLDFPASDATQVQATLRDGSEVSWAHAGLGAALSRTDATALRQLAMAVADDKWVDEAARLAADARPSSPAVTKLLKHFASQARALGRVP